MKTSTKKFLRAASVIALMSSAACGDDTAKIDGGGHGSDAGSGSNIDGSPQPVAFHQVEQLARPGINEALLITNDFMNGYNATAPTFTGVDSTTLNAVVGEGKTVLKAIYLGVCFVNAQTTAAVGSGTYNGTNEMKPAGMDCASQVGTIVQNDGTLTPGAGSAAQAYADKVFSQFEPDVMRIDTSVAKSAYFSPETLCGGSDGPLLCGGRGLTDDVIDVTYDYLLGGAAVPLNAGGGTGLDALKQHLVSDGVGFSTSIHTLSALAVDPANTQQGHKAPTDTFPYSAAPF